MINWWRRWRLERERIDRKAIDLIERHGDQAVYVARKRMVDAMLVGDIIENKRWTLIRKRIRERTGDPGKQGDQHWD